MLVVVVLGPQDPVSQAFVVSFVAEMRLALGTLLLRLRVTKQERSSELGLVENACLSWIYIASIAVSNSE